MNAQKQAREQQQVKQQKELNAATKSNDECISEWQLANKKCSRSLNMDAYLLGGDFDTHYASTRSEYADCINAGKSKYDTCKAYTQCDKRKKSDKGKCDMVYNQASKAKLRTIRADFNSVDKCYTKSLKLHWQCNDEVNNYDKFRADCSQKIQTMEQALSSTWKEGAVVDNRASDLFDDAEDEGI